MRASLPTALHARSVLFLIGIAIIAGLIAAFILPVSLFPQVSFPRVAVTLEAGDRPADQMSVQVTRPVETAIRAIPGVRNIRSTSSRGSADVSVNFDWGEDMQSATLQVQSAVTQALPGLPPGTNFLVRRMDPTVFPVAAFSLVSDKTNQAELRRYAEYQLAPLLSATPGVAKVGVQGGDVAEYQVTVDPDVLVAFGLTIDDIAKALSGANILQAVGRIEDNHKLYLVMTDNQIADLQAIRNTVVRSGASGQLELGDIATVERGAAPNWIIVTADGAPAVSLAVFQKPDGDTIQVVHDVEAKIAGASGKLPPGSELKTWYDQSELIIASAHSVRDAILIGALLAALVLYLFLRSGRLTIIGVAVVPAVLAVSVLVLFVAGMSFNIMTLGGMAAAIGLVIDDAIVMLEEIVRRLAETPNEPHKETVRKAAAGFFKPLAGSSSATIIIFLPLAFLSGVSGAFFQALSLTMASALLVSFLIAWLAIPVLAERFIDGKLVEKLEARSKKSRTRTTYGHGLTKLLSRAWLVLPVAALFLGLGYLASRGVGTGFIPTMDEGGFVLDYRAPPGTSLEDTDRLVSQVEAILSETPDVQTYSRRTGAQLGGAITEADEGDFFVRLKPFPRRPIDVVMSDVRQKVENRVPGLQVELILLLEDLIGDLTAVPQPVEIKIYGDNIDQLLAMAPKISDAISTIPGIVSPESGARLAGDALTISIDRQKAALEGLGPAEIAKQADSYLLGSVPTQVQKGQQLLGIRVWPEASRRAQVQDVEAMKLRAPDGHLVPLKRVATVTRIAGQPQITREDLRRMVAVTARIEGRDIGSTISDVRKALKDSGLIKAPLYYELGGLYQQQQKAFRDLALVFGAAVALVFVLVLFLYESFRIALQFLLIPFFTAGAVFLGLFVTGIDLNITAIMGMTMVIGIVTEVAIFYFSEFQNLQTQGRSLTEALVEAGQNRLRPIAMTTLAAILALLPLAFALGQGADMQQPLAVAIISGLLIQMPLVLLIMPAVFFMICPAEKS